MFFVKTLQDHPELAIFLTLGLGYLVGKLKAGPFSLGAVTGVLLVGVLVGQMDITISPNVKSVFFAMFLFAVGYSVGPQFVRGVAKDGAPQALFAVVISLLCLASVYVAAKVSGYSVGLGAGLLAGSQTISAAIGLASDAINNSGVQDAKAQLDQIPVAYAICYIWGTIGTGLILAQLGPKLIGRDLKQACKEYEAEMSAGAPEGGMRTAWHQLSMRAFQVKAGGKVDGKSVSAAEQLLPDTRVFVERVKRDGQILEFDGNTALKAGDIVAISAPTDVMVEKIEKDSLEVADKDVLDVPVESVDVVVTNKAVAGKTLLELRDQDFARGIYLNKITRGTVGAEIPVLAKTTVQRGDILHVTGTSIHVAALTKAIGYADRPSNLTDMIWVGLVMVAAGLFGAIAVNVGGVPITLSTSGGILIGGLVLGWARSVHPTFGSIPAPTQWFMNSVGLNVFIAIVGISAGPQFIDGLRSAGVGLFIAGFASTSVPMLLAPLIGRFVFRFHPAINLGCCGGARTSTASVAMVGEAAESNVPMLGYTVPYAVSNTLLTLWGMVIVLLLD